MALSKACNTEQMIKVTVAPVTPSGAAARIDGALTVSVSSGAGSFAAVDGEPLSFFAKSGDEPGETVFLLEVDADLGAGVRLLQDTFTLEVSGVEAASMNQTAGEPIAKV